MVVSRCTLALKFVALVSCYRPAGNEACAITCTAANESCPSELGLACFGGFCLESETMLEACLSNGGDAAVDSSEPIDVIATDAPPDLAMCGTIGYTPTGTAGFYKLVTNQQWSTGQTDCQNDAAGLSGVYTHLAVIGSEAERMAVSMDVQIETWVGFSTKDGVNWLHVTNESPVYPGNMGIPPTFGWGGSEPSDPTVEKCAALSPTSMPANALKDFGCTSSFDMLCECDGSPTNPNNLQP